MQIDATMIIIATRLNQSRSTSSRASLRAILSSKEMTISELAKETRDIGRRPMLTASAHLSASSLDHLVGAAEQGQRDGQIQSFSRL